MIKAFKSIITPISPVNTPSFKGSEVPFLVPEHIYPQNEYLSQWARYDIKMKLVFWVCFEGNCLLFS